MKRLLMLMATLLLILTACVEYEEELWLNPNGSGRVRMRLIHRSNFDNTKEFVNKQNLPGIHLISRQTSRVGQNYVYEVEFKFDSIEEFNNVNDRLASADFWGSITLNKTPEGNLIFKRRISLGNQKPDPALVTEEVTDPNLMDDPDDILENIARTQEKHPIWKYKLHVPWKIIGSNANKKNTNLSGRTLSWEYDTLEMWNKYEDMTVEMKKGVSWLVFVLIGVVVLLLGFFAVWMVRIYKRSHLFDVLNHKREHQEKTKVE